MRNKGREQQARSPKGTSKGLAMLVALLLLGETSWADTQYRQLNLVSDQSGVAMLQDTNLVNAWGMSFSSSSPFWISDNGIGKATIYVVTNDASGAVHISKQSLEVTIPGAGNPTGQVFNNHGGFNGDIFLFVSEDGTVSGWRQPLGQTAEVLAMRPSAVYKGVTLVTNSSGPLLLAANFHEGKIDVYNSSGVLTNQFSDPRAPTGYAPFNIQTIEGMVFVTFAKQDADRHDDVPGRGHGLIDVFNPETGLFHRFVTGSDAGGRLNAINSPWGLALAPSTFGDRAGQLLVGNFGSGAIFALDVTGRFRGFLEGTNGDRVIIPGLWGLAFGNGGRAGSPNTLFFTAGPDDESHGLFGSLDPVTDSMDEE